MIRELLDTLAESDNAYSVLYEYSNDELLDLLLLLQKLDERRKARAHWLDVRRVWETGLSKRELIRFRHGGIPHILGPEYPFSGVAAMIASAECPEDLRVREVPG